MQEQSWLAAFDRMPKRIFRNKSGEKAPAFGILRITDYEIVNGEIEFHIEKPDSSSSPVYLVNGPTDVEDDDTGPCETLMNGGNLLVDLGTGTPAFGQTWGPKAGQWSAVKDANGFYVGGAHKGSGARAVVAAIQVPPTSIKGVAFKNGSVSNVLTNVGTDVTGYSASVFGNAGNMGFSFDELTGVATYTGPERDFMHLVTGRARPNSATTLGSVLIGTIDVMTTGGGAGLYYFFWPGARFGFTTVAVDAEPRGVTFVKPMLAQNGDQFRVKVANITTIPPDGISVDSVHWSIIPLEG